MLNKCQQYNMNIYFFYLINCSSQVNRMIITDSLGNILLEKITRKYRIYTQINNSVSHNFKIS